LSDRYDNPRRQVEPQEPEVEDLDEGLDEARENVLEDWPASPLLAPAGEPDGEPAEPAAARFDGEPAPADEPDLAPADEPNPALLEVEPLAAHLAEPAPVYHSAEHAPGILAIPPGYAVLEGVPEGRRRTVGIVVARFNGEVTTRLLQTALDELDRAGVTQDAVTVMPVPGAFELPLAAMALAKTRRFAAVVALGCVIRGDTPHFDYVASEAASGLQLAALETGVPVAFGLLTLDREEQAEQRIGKGAEAVRTALEMADLFANLRAASAT
jgi:6,7-dimethyl-8-ribityllumazine synthase